MKPGRAAIWAIVLILISAGASIAILGTYRPGRRLEAGFAGQLEGTLLLVLAVLYLPAVVTGAACLLLGAKPFLWLAFQTHLVALILVILIGAHTAVPDAGALLATLLVLAPPLAILAVGTGRRGLPAPWHLAGAASAVYLGVNLGVQIWSERLPTRLLASAIAAAAGEAHCIIVPQRSRTTPFRRAVRPVHLTARAIFQPARPYREFHALLAVGSSPDRRYFLWSFATGAFEPLSDYTRQSLLGPGALDSAEWCALPPMAANPAPPYS